VVELFEARRGWQLARRRADAGNELGGLDVDRAGDVCCRVRSGRGNVNKQHRAVVGEFCGEVSRFEDVVQRDGPDFEVGADDTTTRQRRRSNRSAADLSFGFPMWMPT